MLLSIEHLSVQWHNEGRPVTVVDDVSLTLEKGAIFGLVGESGCGKSTLAMAIPRLLPRPASNITSGAICFQGKDLLQTPLHELRRIRGKDIGVIFQDPMTALSPLQTIGNQLDELFVLHTSLSRSARREKSLEWLTKAELTNTEQLLKAYPFELSGGMQQRVMIAQALALEPALLIADEPTTALDVTTQAKILQLMKKLCAGQTALLLITHDIGVVKQTATEIGVMYAGQLVETASADAFFQAPAHPYARALLNSIPGASTRGRPLNVIPGSIAPPDKWGIGCRFAERCTIARPECSRQMPVLQTLAPGRAVRCPFVTIDGTIKESV